MLQLICFSLSPVVISPTPLELAMEHLFHATNQFTTALIITRELKTSNLNELTPGSRM
jgi:hypothetical protein